ncbi:NTP transferase domain-containing protein [Heliobacterium undosum]|uniref:NTP transferase domain-containing protein n=2 Tax=Heliomicrobium undosum TaxID=121734 RepID=A0A845L5I5_9FIRM|nr:NTP transferase domain-containing protein [Heliomicrobium undosum]
MGQQKLLLPLGEKPVLAHAMDRMNQLPWGRRLVVIGEPRQSLADLSMSRGFQAVYNEWREEGQASSVRLAVSTLCPLDGLSGFVFLPGDQPFIEPTLVTAMADAFFQKNDRRAIVVPRHEGQWRSPVLFGAAWRSALSTLTGDRGGRDLIQKNPGCVVSVDWADERPFADVDTWIDYEALQQQK